MVEPAVSDADPLGAFSYLSHYHYGQLANTNNPTYQFAVKPEELYKLPQSSTSVNTNNDYTKSTVNTQNEKQQEKSINYDIKPILKTNGKVKKEKKSFVSQKITEEGYPFYGCAVCNISFPTLRELDSHVTTHKGRLTSYDLRVKNQMKKKRLKKEQKKLKKRKKEAMPDIEIKPEDGYIGNEKASEFGLNNNDTEHKKDAEELRKDQEKAQESINLEKIYKCFACQKQFVLSYYLKLHVRSHTDEKPYTCEQCGQSFITASKLGRHNKRFHLSVQYQCRICYRKFYRFEVLTQHFDSKHAEDKLEGEPYDFNAILPYLKELEEQLREKQEMEKRKPEEDLWSGDWPSVEKEKDVIKEEKNIDIEVVKVSMDDVEIKEEVEDVDYNDMNDSYLINDINNDNGVFYDVKIDNDARNDNGANDHDGASAINADSDEDYFPSNTWLKPEESLEAHLDSNGVKCPVCEKQLSTASYMRVHMRTHTGERPFKCYICDMGFITASKMHRHVLTHPESLKEEIKTEITNENVNEEDKEKVKKAVRKLSKKSSEKNKKYRKRPHACGYCHKRFLHLHTLQIHKKSHDGEEIKYSCQFCLLELQDEEHLKLHESTHTGPKPYQCTICNKMYKKRESMLYHKKNHKAANEFICDICTKAFNAQCKLQRHIISHSVDKYMLKYECPVCAHMFNTKYHVQMHLSTHQKEGVIQEENRNEILAMVLQNARRIPRKGETHNLTDVIPSDERSRVCNICGEVFQHFYYLEEHLKSHGSRIAIENIDKEEEKKYICEVCNKGFKLHYYLKLHSFTHTKEKPFICQQCGKGFITRGKLKRHLETHTGLKKYQCHICCKFFTRPSYLRIHVRTIHGAQLVRLGLS